MCQWTNKSNKTKEKEKPLSLVIVGKILGWKTSSKLQQKCTSLVVIALIKFRRNSEQFLSILQWDNNRMEIEHVCGDEENVD